MKFWELWEEVERKNPTIKTGIVMMYSPSFKKALRYAYDKGRDEVAGSKSDVVSDLLGMLNKK